MGVEVFVMLLSIVVSIRLVIKSCNSNLSHINILDIVIGSLSSLMRILGLFTMINRI